jgi:hypothetical protein
MLGHHDLTQTKPISSSIYLISRKRQADDAACFDAQQEASSTFPPLIPLLFVLQQTPISPLYFRFLFSVSSFMLCALP